MNKLIEFGRKALFYARVFSGYEERRIRSYRLQLENHIKQAQEKKASVRKVPEQIILSKVHRMVEEMQALNKKLQETAAVDEYFKPIDKQAEMIMKIQLEGEEKTAKEMMKAMQRQALPLLEKEMEKLTKVNRAGESNQPKQSSDEGRATNS